MEISMNKNKSFQGLRGLFAILILLSHCSFVPKNSLLGSIVLRLSNVSFFFVLSGFLLYMTFRDQTFVSFIKKKFIRLWPLHLLTLFAMVFVKLVTHSFDHSLAGFGTLFLNGFLLQTWYPNVNVATSFNTVSWFLSSLLFCYICGFWLIKLVNKKRRLAWVLITLSIVVFLTIKIVFAFLFPNDNGWGYYFTYLCPLACFPDFLLGFVVFELSKRIRLRGAALLTCQILSILLICIMFCTKTLIPQNFSRGFYSIPFSLFLVFSFAEESKMSTIIFGNKIFVFLGEISFEIYLIHDLLITAFYKYTPAIELISTKLHPAFSILLVVIASVFAGCIYHFAFNFLKNNIKKRKSISSEKL